MWFRYLIISFLSVIASGIAAVVAIGLILPSRTPVLLLTLAIWAVSFIITFLFANWALSKRLPTRQDSLLLVAIHLLVFTLMYLAYGTFMSDRGPWVIVAPEILVQLALETTAIFLAAYRMRRQTIRSVLVEGMTI